MTTPAILTDLAIERISAAVFDNPHAWVAEAYSDFDTLPRQFTSPNELAQYAKEKLAQEKGSVHLFVNYPDMGGRAIRQTILLTPGSIPGHRLRYSWEGWGLVSIILERGDQPGSHSRVSANSEKRAAAWESSYPKLDPPGTWNWKAVASHARRLQRVLNRIV